MTKFKSFAAALGLIVPLAMAVNPASAEDHLKLVMGHINNWENQAPTLGQEAGIFKKYNLSIEAVNSRGGGDGLSGLAEADERNARDVAAHGATLERVFIDRQPKWRCGMTAEQSDGGSPLMGAVLFSQALPFRMST